MARALFDEGLRFVDSGAWQDAADRFSRLLAIRYSPVAAYNFALAQTRLGKIVTAVETLRTLLADSALEAKVRDPALALQAEVESKVGWLTVEVRGDADGCTLLVDDRVWPAAAWGVGVPVDPGNHKLELRRGSSLVRSGDVEVAAGAHLEKILSLSTAPEPVAVAASSADHDRQSAPAAALAADDDASDGAGILSNPWFWVGAGAVLVGATTVLVIAASGGGSDPAMPVKGDFTPAIIEGKVP